MYNLPGVPRRTSSCSARACALPYVRARALCEYATVHSQFVNDEMPMRIVTVEKELRTHCEKISAITAFKSTNYTNIFAHDDDECRGVRIERTANLWQLQLRVVSAPLRVTLVLHTRGYAMWLAECVCCVVFCMVWFCVLMVIS